MRGLRQYLLLLGFVEVVVLVDVGLGRRGRDLQRRRHRPEPLRESAKRKKTADQNIQPRRPGMAVVRNS